MSEIKDTQQHPKVEISVKNFGPIAEANIDLRPLTVFVGPSNTGKTYFATLIYALHGAFNGLFHSSLLPPFKFRGMDILNELMTGLTASEEEIQEILDKLDMDERPFRLSDLPEEIRQTLGTIIKDTDFFREELQDELRNCFNLNSISQLMRLTGKQRNETTVLLKIGEKAQEYLNISMRISKSGVNLNNLTSLNISSYNDIVLLPNECSASGRLLDNIVSIRSFSYPEEHSRYYLPAARSSIMQSHRIIASSLVKQATQAGVRRSSQFPTIPGVIADFMEKIILYEEKTDFEFDFDEKMQDPAEILESDVLAGRILLKSTPSGYPDFYYRPQGVEEDIHLSQASSMVSELAPLVLFLRNLVYSGDILIIEEPEAHLHPGAQADMAVVLARLVRAGVRVIVTTHSDWLLEEIGNLILEGLLAEETDEPASWLLPEEVGAWHFQKDEPVKEIAFDTRVGISPKDFEDVAEGLYNRSVNLQQRFEKKKGGDERESS
ncbi:MAG: AAA family ATPase [Candidatus Poribacteria bacterium]|nr:AAA family ATPase [Candidatus Poribacteria bacterium]